ncbi:MAG: molybdopterin-dependent oxidoreductase Mo/Fe-S-binding subunit, partial [Spirochaetales bacterium]
MIITFNLDGKDCFVGANPWDSALTVLKRMGVNSVRNSDDCHGFAGSDTILLDGKIVGANLLLAAQLEGREVRTVRSLRQGRALSAVQQALIDAGCVQSGYNAPAAALMITDLLKRIPRPSRDDVKDALSGLFNRATGYEQFFEAVKLASARINGEESSGKAGREFGGASRYVGKNYPKVDAEALVAGEKSFVEDRVENGSCFMKVLGSPYAHALIKSIDTSEAENHSEVVAVFTYKNVPHKPYSQAGQGFPEPSPYDRVLLDRKLRHHGDRVAAVVAETEKAAEEALKLIKVEYEILPHVMTLDEARAPDAPLIHGGPVEYRAGAPEDLDALNAQADPEETPVVYQFPIGGNPRKNISSYVEGGIGDVEKGFAEADVVLERTYETTQIQCTPLEKHTSYARPWGNKIIIHASTQVPYHLRRIVAGQLGIPENNIRVIKERVGGGYGSKQDVLLDELTAWAAWQTARPVFYQYSRKEEFISCSTRKPMRIKVKLGAGKDGTFTAMRMDVESNQGAYGA